MTLVATDDNTLVCEVYWIRRECHLDMFSEGYIGISTKGTAARFVIHKSAAKNGSNYPVHNAIRKYGDIVVSTILIGTLEYCQDVENKLRPTPRIGWNLATGGGKIMLGYKMSEESRKRISENNGSRGRVYSEEERESRSKAALNRQFKHSEETIDELRQKAYKRIEADGGEQVRKAINAAARANMFNPPWENPNADKDTWLIADEVFNLFCAGEIQYRVAKHFGISSHKLIAMYKRFKEGWNPGLCPEWQQFKTQF